MNTTLYLNINGVRFMSNNTVFIDLILNTVEQYIDPNNFPINALVKEEDIIYTRTGSLGLVFRGKRGVLHNNSFKVVPNKKLSNDFLFIWLQNPAFNVISLIYRFFSLIICFIFSAV